MTRQKKFDMGTTRPATATAPAPAEIDYFVAGQAAAEEPLERLNFVLPRRLRIQFNQEAAARDVKKQDLLREIFEFYFSKK